MCDHSLRHVNSRSAKIVQTTTPDLFSHTPTREPSSFSENPPLSIVWSSRGIQFHKNDKC